MKRKKILLVEDEEGIRQMLGYALMKAGYEPEEAADAGQALDYLQNNRPDLVLIDWMLPGVSGVDLVRRMRANRAWQSIPAIMLTARGQEDDKVQGLKAGADDFVTKPFSNRELLARIHALLRRVAPEAEREKSQLCMEGLVLDKKSHRASVHGKELKLRLKEFHLLQFFLEHPEAAFTRRQLLNKVWGENIYVEERTVDVHMRRLRNILAPYGLRNLLQTVRGVGYRCSRIGADGGMHKAE